MRVKATRLLKQTKILYITRCQMNNVSVNVFPVLRVSLDPLVSLFFFLSSIPPGILQRRSLWRAHHEWLREPAKNYSAELVCKGDALIQNSNDSLHQLEIGQEGLNIVQRWLKVDYEGLKKGLWPNSIFLGKKNCGLGGIQVQELKTKCSAEKELQSQDVLSPSCGLDHFRKVGFEGLPHKVRY